MYHQPNLPFYEDLPMDIEDAIHYICENYPISYADAEKIVTKSKDGQEFAENVEYWLHNRFLPNLVFIDQTGYTKMCVNALKVLDRTAPTDYGSSRQRDLGQIWADTTRGYLGEYAVKLFLESKWRISADLGHEAGELTEYLPTDIHHLTDSSGISRRPSLNVSIKTTKFNGIWLDITGDQFSHSDVFLLVKVATGRDHLFAFFKEISVFRDKVLRQGQEVGSLSAEEADDLFNALPSFSPIPAYICGFVRSDNDYQELSYEGRMGIKHYTINSWNGPIQDGDLQTIKIRENVPEGGKVLFKNIRNFSHSNGYLFNTGKLKWLPSDWNAFVQQL